jgi:hypothetical protein
MELKYTLRQNLINDISNEEAHELIKKAFPKLPFISPSSRNNDSPVPERLYSTRDLTDFFRFNHKYAVRTMIITTKRYDFEGRAYSIKTDKSSRAILTLDSKGVIMLALNSWNKHLLPLINEFNLFLIKKQDSNITYLNSNTYLSDMDVITPLTTFLR